MVHSIVLRDRHRLHIDLIVILLRLVLRIMLACWSNSVVQVLPVVLFRGSLGFRVVDDAAAEGHCLYARASHGSSFGLQAAA